MTTPYRVDYCISRYRGIVLLGMELAYVSVDDRVPQREHQR